jgi:hypothetical protein
MYVPHFGAILNNLGIAADEFQTKQSVEVPVPLLKMLLQIAVASGDFNKDGYLSENPDIANAVRTTDINPLRHYIEFGFFEGRTGACPPVDEFWYRNTYADIDSAVQRGDLASGREHFTIQGAAEGRAPSARYQADALQWKAAFNRL